MSVVEDALLRAGGGARRLPPFPPPPPQPPRPPRWIFVLLVTFVVAMGLGGAYLFHERLEAARQAAAPNQATIVVEAQPTQPTASISEADSQQLGWTLIWIILGAVVAVAILLLIEWRGNRRQAQQAPPPPPVQGVAPAQAAATAPAQAAAATAPATQTPAQPAAQAAAPRAGWSWRHTWHTVGLTMVILVLGSFGYWLFKPAKVVSIVDTSYTDTVTPDHPVEAVIPEGHNLDWSERKADGGWVLLGEETRLESRVVWRGTDKVRIFTVKPGVESIEMVIRVYPCTREVPCQMPAGLPSPAPVRVSDATASEEAPPEPPAREPRGDKPYGTNLIRSEGVL